MKKSIILAVVLAVLCSSCVTGWKIEDPDAARFRVSFVEQELTIYDIAARITGCPAVILQGLHFAESSYGKNLDHPGPFDRGPFGLNEKYRSERVKKWGEYNPDCPLQSAIIAGRIVMENYRYLGQLDLAVCAYRQGVGGIRRDGAGLWYYSRVMKAPARV